MSGRENGRPDPELGRVLGLLGLSDITAANVADVIGKDNGGGIHVIFDSDGSILRDVLGVGYGVLGVATPELVEDGSPAIHESWVIINGQGIPDPASYPGIDVVAEFTGVITHEFGHAINLAHSQTNDAVVFYGDKPVPQSCDDSAVGYPDVQHVETMYPFISPGWTGAVQSTVDMLDDRVSVSNIYPSPGWPASYGSVAGAILMPDGSTPTMDVNVVARNMADPFADAVSALSGDYTQGELGTDGRGPVRPLRRRHRCRRVQHPARNPPGPRGVLQRPRRIRRFQQRQRLLLRADRRPGGRGVGRQHRIQRQPGRAPVHPPRGATVPRT